MWAKFLLFGIVVYAGVRAFRLLTRFLQSDPSEKTASAVEEKPVLNEMVRDPICGLYISSNDALSEIRRGSRIWFCSEECRLKFLQKEG